MADQIPDPTAWSDDQLDNLLDALAQRAAERDDVHLSDETSLTRRSLLGALGATAGAGLLGSRVASAAGESWSESSGTLGTDNQPLKEVNSKRGHFQSVQAEQLTSASFPDLSGAAAFLSVDYGYSTADNLDKVPLDATSHDDGGFNTNTGTYRVQRDGRYLLTAMLRSASAGSGARIRATISVNGSVVCNDERLADGSPTQLSPSPVIRDLSQGDDVELRFQNFASDDTVGSGASRTYLHVQQLPRP